jgi:pyruvate dehydrogenase E1 component alpha subunit
MGTSIARHCSITELHKRGESFGIPGIEIDGMNILEVMQKGKEAVEYARSGNGPIFIEMKTYRYRGHSMSDPGNYRTKEEVTQMRETRDPIDSYRNHILKNKLATEEDLKAIDKEVKQLVEEATEFSHSSPEPDPSELYTEVYI